MATLLDASAFNSSPGAEARTQFTRDLVRCLVEHGYVRLKNHGIPDEAVLEAFKWSRRFFELPTESKHAIHNPPGPNPQRGYSSRGAEKTSSLYAKLMGREYNDKLQDAREHFDQGSPDDDEFPNVYPAEAELPGFKEFMVDFYSKCQTTSFAILAALEEALQIPRATFESLCQPRNASELRLNRYPEITLEEMRSGNVNRISPHFDLGVITMLFADSVGGLEFQDRRQGDAEVFVPVEPGGQTEIILNVSETMQRWTLDRLPASLHRVTIPRSMEMEVDGVIPTRYSIAYFCKAHRNASVGTLPQFISAGMDTKYEDLTAIQYHQKRLESAVSAY